MQKLIMILIDPAVNGSNRTAALNHVQVLISAAYEHWWHWMYDVWIVRTEQSADEVYKWLDRVWPKSDGTDGSLSRCASYRSCVLIFEVSPSLLTMGRLPAEGWLWFKEIELRQDQKDARKQDPS